MSWVPSCSSLGPSTPLQGTPTHACMERSYSHTQLWLHTITLTIRTTYLSSGSAAKTFWKLKIIKLHDCAYIRMLYERNLAFLLPPCAVPSWAGRGPFWARQALNYGSVKKIFQPYSRSYTIRSSSGLLTLISEHWTPPSSRPQKLHPMYKREKSLHTRTHHKMKKVSTHYKMKGPSTHSPPLPLTWRPHRDTWQPPCWQAVGQAPSDNTWLLSCMREQKKKNIHPIKKKRR
jgi:hypothetical protein